ncbi:hypothetical protein ACFQ7F_35040 [Streptomyces sp. NPDC056486]|uniref:hypothetical protein n=1 Tax=Streptomyces sp. NPDC056486 TaxID=3345835 RepID=UPI0036C8E837
MSIRLAESMHSPDKVEILADITVALGWELTGTDLPSVRQAMGLVERFTYHGRSVARDLGTQCLNLSSKSDAGHCAQVILGEADRWLYAPPLNPLTQQMTVQRAQKLARVVRGVNRAAGADSHEQAARARTAPRPPPGR